MCFCIICLWTHIFTTDIISVYGGEGVSIFHRSITTMKDGMIMSEKKSRYTEAQAKAAKKYLKESVEDIRIRVPKGDKAKVQAHATSTGESMNAFVVRAIDETMKRDNQNME